MSGYFQWSINGIITDSQHKDKCWLFATSKALIMMQNISMKRQVTRLNENRKLVQAFNFKSAISEQAKSTGHSSVWACSTKIFSQENHLLSCKICQFSTSRLLVVTRVITSPWSTEWSCSLVIKSRLHNLIQIVDNGTWMSSESPDKLSIYFVGVWGLCLCFFSFREVWI